jgi:hypothetical protein
VSETTTKRTTATVYRLEYRRPGTKRWMVDAPYATRAKAVTFVKRANAFDKKCGIAPCDWRIVTVETTTTMTTEYLDVPAPTAEAVER